uniref:NADH dehydrogenase subunit 6 n=1 Tax=Calisoga longitarsis TaxID=394809 RepID=B2CKV4_9ARAC|nr:NADH dehydrogenase subunit 6 [Calisoga longitarsis]
MMMVILLGIMFVGSSQPMSLVLLLIFVTLSYVLYLYVVMKTFWYSFVIMIVMLSGVLVVFTYMASMSPNEKFIWSGISLMILIVVFLGVLVDGWGYPLSHVSLKLWDGWTMLVVGWLISFLLVVMLMVIWVSEWGDMAARSS